MIGYSSLLELNYALYKHHLHAFMINDSKFELKLRSTANDDSSFEKL